MAQDLTIKQGKTFTLVIRAETDPVIRKPITGISLSSGAPRITAAAHSVTNGWRGYVTRVKGMVRINAENTPAKATDFHPMTLIDSNTIEFNDITPVDDKGVEWPSYLSGGFLEFFTPIDLAGKTVRMKIRTKQDKTSDLLVSSEAGDTPKNVLSLVADNTNKTITLTIKATDTDDFVWKTGYYDIELVGPTADDVLELANGKVTVTREVTA